MTFKVGDKVKLVDGWSGRFPVPENLNITRTISSIEEAYHHPYLGAVIKVNFEEDKCWAEPHEIRHLTPLEEAMK